MSKHGIENGFSVRLLLSSFYEWKANIVAGTHRIFSRPTTVKLLIFKTGTLTRKKPAVGTSTHGLVRRTHQTWKIDHLWLKPIFGFWELSRNRSQKQLSDISNDKFTPFFVDIVRLISVELNFKQTTSRWAHFHFIVFSTLFVSTCVRCPVEAFAVYCARIVSEHILKSHLSQFAWTFNLLTVRVRIICHAINCWRENKTKRKKNIKWIYVNRARASCHSD